MPQQVSRLLVVFALAGASLITARYLAVPETFGELGHYRAASLDSIRVRPISYAGRQECALCHSDVEATRAASNHRGVSCEVCHDPAAGHVAAPMETKPAIHRDRELCVVCFARWLFPDWVGPHGLGTPEVSCRTGRSLAPGVSGHVSAF